MSSLLVHAVHGLRSCLAPGSIVMPIAPNSRRMPLHCAAPSSAAVPAASARGLRPITPLLSGAALTLVARQLAVGHPVRPGGVRAEAFHLVFLVRAEVALEPEPLGLVVLVALPRQDVCARAVEEPAVVRDHHRAAGEFL